MVVFVPAAFSVSVNFVVHKVVVVVGVIVGRAVHVDLSLSLIVGRVADLREVDQFGSGGETSLHQCRQPYFYAFSRQESLNRQFVAGFQQAQPGGGAGPVRIVDQHALRQVIGDLDVVGRNFSLIDDGDGKVHLLSRSNHGSLSRCQSFDECQIEGLGKDRGGIVVVFVATLLAVSGYVVVGEENVVAAVGIGLTIHIDGRIPNNVLYRANFSKVGNGRVGG